MKLEINIGERCAEVELLDRKGNYAFVSVDGEVYKLDYLELQKGNYSVLNNHISYNLEVVETDKPKKYKVSREYNHYDVEVVDAESKYLKARGKGGGAEDDNAISSPMPGKVVKILVEEGDEVAAGTAVVIVSAMKMESEYKVKQDRKIIEVCVKEGDNIDGGQPLVIVE
ncbi:MAG: acetyl-CoA carboxylase biotin carboxyl carrier protein subunit [Bacteroidetes bacterium]|nr:MAG: acetyl-CoA carboxylase biotin carboxyl carrier protein subunit [Bacteroidota bacterium]